MAFPCDLLGCASHISLHRAPVQQKYWACGFSTTFIGSFWGVCDTPPLRYDLAAALHGDNFIIGAMFSFPCCLFCGGGVVPKCGVATNGLLRGTLRSAKEDVD